jgi:hypothetical protein
MGHVTTLFPKFALPGPHGIAAALALWPQKKLTIYPQPK